MRLFSFFLLGTAVVRLGAADLESRVLTHYVPQDQLETVVRTEGWTEVVLKVAGGVRKGDTIRVWAGGVIDRGNGDRPSQFADGPQGAPFTGGAEAHLSLAVGADHAYALLARTEAGTPKKAMPEGKPLELLVTRDQEKFHLGFNDEKGRFADNHLGRGRRHELSPLWVRIEVVRTITD